MQAVERIVNYDYWISLFFVIAFVILAILKLLKPNGLYGYIVAFFTPGFFHKQAEKNTPFFSSFQLLLFVFTSLVLSLFFFEIIPAYVVHKSITTLSYIFGATTMYLLIRALLDAFIVSVLGLKGFLNYFLYSKLGYLKTLSIWLLPVLILNQYTIKSINFIVAFFLILVGFRFLLIIYNNKRLVVNKLFYFILYLCALEIAPLLILYKTTTT
ncbi:conserved membrane protein of unknown function [Tenacibaculum sp. 190130A14a]|uniref:DUF4271 domain-containing protein n=1 Tax=Tenacibaculum polynesiense TaxID=3137857 RepID=A0ABP1F0B0_9FLAO